MSTKTKLELTWIGKDERPRLEPRILLPDLSRSYSSGRTTSSIDANQMIYGDNLLSLRAVEADYHGSVKCVYIDPPFNTGEMFEHYDDGVEHSLWLTQMRDRLEAIHRLLTEDGTLAVHIDDNELSYLTVLLDEIFGRQNRAFTVTFKQGSATGHKSINPGCVNTTNFLLIYAKNKHSWTPNRIHVARARDKRYNQFIENIEDAHGDWVLKPLASAFAEYLGIHLRDARKIINSDPSQIDRFVLDNANSVSRTARPSYKDVSQAERNLIDESKANPSAIFLLKRDKHSDMYLKNGERLLFYADKLKLIDGKRVAGEPLTTLWDDILSNNLHKEGGVSFPKGKNRRC